MDEHVHEWEYAWIDSPEHHRFVCRCGEFLEDDEIERRLNAVETLKTLVDKRVGQDYPSIYAVVHNETRKEKL